MRRASLAALSLALLWVPSPSGAQTPSEPSRPPFEEFLEGIRTEAVSRGIRQDVVDEALGHIDEPLPVVLERDRAQAESVFSLERYISRLLTPTFLKNARERFAEHRPTLLEVSGRYGVAPGVIAAIWGVESNFGRFSGVRPTVVALATLAWDPRRSTLFRRELFDALDILNRGDISVADMRGSWAGAMGQPQFMPSSYLRFAEDFDGDGRRDIWNSSGDVFASIANYLNGHGWTAGESWGREVRISRESAPRISAEVPMREGSCKATRDMTVALPATRWDELGVRLPQGQHLPTSHTALSLVSGTTRHFLVGGNYEALLEYNCSHAYAVTVGLLADSIDRRAAAPRTPKAGRRR